jgi:hypothetical protein
MRISQDGLVAATKNVSHKDAETQKDSLFYRMLTIKDDLRLIELRYVQDPASKISRTTSP